jgi:predicted alpha/beta-hydrolase family hydrolase
MSLLDTPHGPARLHRFDAEEPRALLVLLPGASGSVEAPDLHVAARAAHAAGVTTILVEPPYRLAGRRTPPRGRVDGEVLASVVEQVRPRDLPLVLGGRSYGSRIACRAARPLGSSGVLCLAFPLHPPGKPEKSRLEDVEAPGDLPVLVIQGRSDAFGRTPDSDTREVLLVEGDHSLRKDHELIASTIVDWLGRLI